MHIQGGPLAKMLPFVVVTLLVVGGVLMPAAIFGLDSDVLFEGEFSSASSPSSGTTFTVGSVELDPGEYEVWMEEAPSFLFISLADYEVEVVDEGGTPVRTGAAEDAARKINGIESERRSTIKIDTKGVYDVQVTEVMDFNITGSMWVFVITPRPAAYYAAMWGGIAMLIAGVVLIVYMAIQRGAKERAEERARRAQQVPPAPVAPAYPPYPPYPPYQAYPQAPPPYQPYPQPPPPYPQPPPPQQQPQRPPEP